MSSSSVSSSASSLEGLDYSRDVFPISSTEKNGGIWRVMALNSEEIVSASYDHLAKIWIPKEEEYGLELTNIKVLKGHEKEVLSLSKLSEEIFLTGSSDSTMAFWNSNDGTLDSFLIDGEDPTGFYSIEVLNSNTIATGSCQKPKKCYDNWDHVIKIWDATKKQLIFKLKGHTGGISKIVKINDNVIASSSGDKSIRIWDLNDRSTSCRFENHLDYVYGLTKLSDNKLVSASKDRTMRVFDVDTEKEVGEFSHTEDNKAHSSTVYDVNSFGENILASASRDGYVKVWDLRLLKCIKMLDVDDGFVYGVNFSPEGKIFAGTAGKSDPKIRKKKKQNKANIVMWDFKKI